MWIAPLSDTPFVRYAADADHVAPNSGFLATPRIVGRTSGIAFLMLSRLIVSI